MGFYGGIFDVITALQQGVLSIMAGMSKIRMNNTNVGNFAKKIECSVELRVCKILNMPLIFFMINSSSKIEILPLYSSLKRF